MNSPLILMALEMESRGRFDTLPVIYTGVGKVNAAYGLMKAIREHAPTHIINLGSAGSGHFNTGELVNCTAFIQRDMDATALDFALHQTPFDKMPPLLHYGEHLSDFPKAVCGSGDNFHTAGTHAEYNVMDMEAYALARICQQENLPFICIKYISDGADHTAANNWEKALEDGAEKLRKAWDQSINSKIT